MSSPIAKTNKSGFDKALIAGHQQLSHSRRISCLVQVLGSRIKDLGLQGPMKVLDVGCGDMTLARGLLAEINGIDLTGVDIYPPPANKEQLDPIWRHYLQFDGCSLPFEDHSFDVVIFSDVLHHVPTDILPHLLASAARVGWYVLIKDHFEYGWYSRHMLRVMDFLGNYGYGVSVPDYYFSVSSFARIIKNADLRIHRVDTGIRLYDHLPIVKNILSPRWQFVATCAKS